MPDSKQNQIQSAHEPNVETQQSLQRQDHDESGQLHGTHSPAKILELPTELLYDVLDWFLQRIWVHSHFVNGICFRL